MVKLNKARCLLASCFILGIFTLKAEAAVKKNQKARLAKVKKPSRQVASVADVLPVVVFSESTQFENLIAKKEMESRRPAGFDVKARVIGVRREIGLTRAESDNTPQDIVINGGTDAGISEGMTVKVMRKVPVLDPFRENQQGELEVNVGTLKVIHVQADMAVARIERLASVKDKGVGLTYRSIMVGDFIGP